MQKILVWDWPVRLGHWLMVGGFALAWLTGDSETFRLVHVIAGATVFGVATFRLPWGFIGSRYARFVDFVRGPAAVKDYVVSLLRLQPDHHVGHNPAGGWAIVLLLGLGIVTGLNCGTWIDSDLALPGTDHPELVGEWLMVSHSPRTISGAKVHFAHSGR